MKAGSNTAINANVIVLLCWACISWANILTDIPKSNPLGINWDPAPSPDHGPPLSASASRDPALLPAQIGGIVGAYLLTVCVVGVVLLLIGRRLRHIIQRSGKALDIEMVEPRFGASGFDPSPISPGAGENGARNFSWPSPEKADRNPYVFPPTKAPNSPPGGGDPFVDTQIVQADREMLQRDLEDLYAHVMEQEDAKAAGVGFREMPPPTQLQSAGPVPVTSPQRPNTLPKKVEKPRPTTLNFDEPKSHSRASSIISSLKSPKRKGVRGMRISSPIPTPLSATFPGSQASDEEPLSPRYYSPPPPPPVPKDQAPYAHHRNNSSMATISPTRSIAEQLSPYENNRGLTNFHRPSQISIQSSSRGDPSSATSATSSTPLYPTAHHQQLVQHQLQAPIIRHPGPHTSNPSSINSSVRALPLRQFEPALSSPSFSHSTKTTVLERTSPVGGGQQTGGLKTPWSAGAVPYSPYQPFTPLMPITPRLVTKEERKQKKKMEGRTPVLEMIKSEGELWDSAY